jgi:uncharacterized protein
VSGTGSQPVQGGSSARGEKGQKNTRPFVVNVHRLRARSGNRMELHLAGEIEDLSYGPELEGAPRQLGPRPEGSAVVPEGAEVSFDGWAESTLGGVTVAGQVSAPFVGICRRCLELAEGTLQVEVRELFVDPNDRLAERVSSEEEYYPVRADELDVQPMVRDACILELPLAPLCSESCAGLCPSCGANRNEQACVCEQEIDPRWAGLTGLLGGGGEIQPAGDDEQADQEAE